MRYAFRKPTLVVCSGASTAVTRRKKLTLNAARGVLCLLALSFAFATAAIAQNIPAGRQQVLVSPFEAGATHVAGRYGFTNGNFLVEGANTIRQLGSSSIFIYLTPDFRTNYPDRGDHLWPDQNPTSLVQLAKTAPFQSVLNMPFRTFVITAFSFANDDQISQFATSTSAAAAEQQEFYDLTKYLYATFAGSGKTFILKNWEGDWAGLQAFDSAADISPTMINAMTNWLIARQKGVSQARSESSNLQGVAVLNAVEVNRIFDYSQNGLRRVINKVVPFVQTDMVTYSSYDSSLAGTDPTSEASAMNQAIGVINSLAPDPLELGSRRMLISEYGLYENELPTETIWRTQTILSTAKSAGLLGAFTWQVFDNECRDLNNNYFPIGSITNTAVRPDNTQCRGLWLLRPDGSESTVVSLLSPYWSDASAPPAPPAPGPGVTVLSPQNNATVPTNLRTVAFATSAYPITGSAVYVDDVLFLKNYTNNVDNYVSLSPGWHHLVLQAWDSSGKVFKTSLYVNAALTPLPGFVPVLTVTPRQAFGARLTVTASTSQSLGSGLSSTINFGDGAVVTGPTASHTYNSIGNYLVTAVVSDSAGNSGTTAATVRVNAPPTPPSPGTVVTINSPGGQASSPVHVSASTSSSASYVAMVLFVDGNPIYSAAGTNLDTFASMSAGTHSLLVQAWGRPNSGDELALLASASGSVSVTVNTGITVTSPISGGTYGSPVHFAASAISGSCGAGIASMGIYTAPGVLAYVQNGATLDTQLPLSPGTYNTVVQAWDKCGGALQKAITITVGGGGSSGVFVSSPANNSNVSSPVHFAATASTSTCAAGIASMGIYTAPGVLAYVQNGATLDTQLSLSAGTYNTVVQAWDNCGGALQKPITITVGGGGNNGVFVSSPASNSSVSSPVHFAATASTSTCAGGIASMGIYTAPGVLAYVQNGATLNTQLPLSTGTYNAVVQAWDNCGGALKTTVNITVQ